MWLQLAGQALEQASVGPPQERPQHITIMEAFRPLLHARQKQRQSQMPLLMNGAMQARGTLLCVKYFIQVHHMVITK